MNDLYHYLIEKNYKKQNEDITDSLTFEQSTQIDKINKKIKTSNTILNVSMVLFFALLLTSAFPYVKSMYFGINFAILITIPTFLITYEKLRQAMFLKERKLAEFTNLKIIEDLYSHQDIFKKMLKQLLTDKSLPGKYWDERYYASMIDSISNKEQFINEVKRFLWDYMEDISQQQKQEHSIQVKAFFQNDHRYEKYI